MRKLAAVVMSFAAIGLATTPAMASDANGNHAAYKWVLGTTNTSMARDGSTITLMGHGTLKTGRGKMVTGGGTFTGTAVGSGTWTATAIESFVSYGPAGPEPFPLPPGATGGKAKLRVALSNGQTGVLTIFCVLGSPPPGTMEGIHLVLDEGEGGKDEGEGGNYKTIVVGNTVFIAI